MLKSRRAVSLDNLGGYQLMDVSDNVVLLGSRFDADLADIEWFLSSSSCAELRLRQLRELAVAVILPVKCG